MVINEFSSPLTEIESSEKGCRQSEILEREKERGHPLHAIGCLRDPLLPLDLDRLIPDEIHVQELQPRDRHQLQGLLTDDTETRKMTGTEKRWTMAAIEMVEGEVTVQIMAADTMKIVIGRGNTSTIEMGMGGETRITVDTTKEERREIIPVSNVEVMVILLLYALQDKAMILHAINVMVGVISKLNVPIPIT